jgi:hypothetical protein
MSDILNQSAVLMRFTQTCVGTGKTDRALTAEVQAEKHMTEDSGDWRKRRWPKDALKPITSKIGEAKAYHDRVTLPFGVKSDEAKSKGAHPIAGMGILPASLISEYGDKLNRFSGELEKLVQDFVADPWRWVQWAMKAHNGTFDPDLYPGCSRDASGNVTLDEAVFRAEMTKEFGIHWEPMPIPASCQFNDTLKTLLGDMAQAVDVRVADAELEAKRELMRRLIKPVQAMADKLMEEPKGDKTDIIFRDTLVQNIRDIVSLAPKLNITGDKAIDGFVAEVEKLTRYTPDTLRSDKATRSEAQKQAVETLKRLSGYQL